MIEKAKIKTLIQDVFQCDASDSYNLLYAYCTCKTISEESCFADNVEKAYLNVKNNCTNSEKLTFLRIASPRRFDKLDKLCNCFSKMRFITFLSVFISDLVCDAKEFVHLKLKCKLSWLNVGYLICTMNSVHNSVSGNSFSSAEEVYKCAVKSFFEISGKKLKISRDMVEDFYKAVCLIKLEDDGICRLKDATEVVELCVQNGIPKTTIPEFILVASNSSKSQKLADKYSISGKNLLLCQKSILKQSYKEIELLCAASYNPNANDIYLENCYLYPRFSAAFSDIENPTVVVFSPSDFYIRKLLQDSNLRDINFVIVLTSKFQCKILTDYYIRMNFNRSGSMRFCTYNGIFEDNNISADGILIFTTRVTEENQKQIASLFADMCNVDTQVFSLHESDEFEKKYSHISQFVMSEKVDVKQIDVLPLGLMFSEGKKKKILVKWSINEESAQKSFEDNQIRFVRYDLINDNYQYLSKSPKVLYASEKELFENGNSIRSFIRSLVYVNKSGQIRMSAKKFRFSPELSVFSTTDNPKSDGTVRMRCYLKKPSSAKHKGVKIKESERDYRDVLAINIPDVIEEYLYGTKGGKLIRDYIREYCFEFANPKKLSLKTFFYLYFDWKKWQDDDEEMFDCAKTIINSEIGEFDIIGTSAKDYEQAYYDAEFDNVNLDFEKYVEILQEVCQSAVALSFCTNNIWSDFSPDLSRNKGERYDVAKFARNAMSNRFLLLSQVKKVYSRVLKYINSGKIEYVAVLIKLFTGMTNQAISRLLWNDFGYCEEYCFYMLTYPIDENRYLAGRCIPHDIPCVGVLADALLKIKKELQKTYSDEEICMMPIVTNFKRKSNVFDACAPEDIRILCKSLLDFLDTTDIVIDLDDGDLLLKPFKGDVIRETFRRVLKKYTDLTLNEIAIIMGAKPLKTHSRCYASYQEEEVLHRLYNKLSSIEKLIK